MTGESPSSPKTEYRRQVPIGRVTIRLPDDAVPLAHIVWNHARRSFHWEVAGEDWQNTGHDVESLNSTLMSLDEVPSRVTIVGFGIERDDIVRVDLSYDARIVIWGTDLNWVAGLQDRFAREVANRFPHEGLWNQLRPWAGPAIVICVVWIPINVLLQFVLKIDFAIVLALSLTSGGWVSPWILGWFGYKPWRKTEFQLSRPAATSSNEIGLLAFARRVAPLATIFSFLITLTGLTFVISDRCNRPPAIQSVQNAAPTPSGPIAKPTP